MGMVQALRDYGALARQFIDKSLQTLATKVVDVGLPATSKALEIKAYIDHSERQIDQIERRVIEGETIAHKEKVLPIFQPHTEWISKGKAGVPVELGLKVCIVESTQGYLLHHRVMQKQTDEQIAIDLITETQARYPNRAACRFDKGFHSPKTRLS